MTGPRGINGPATLFFVRGATMMDQQDTSEGPATEIMNARQMTRALKRIAHEVLERNGGVENLVVVGIHTRGGPLADRLADMICDAEGTRPPVAVLDVTFYRDDFRLRPKAPEGFSHLPFPVDDVNVLLVDDVLFTGRTTRAAMNAIMDFGRPKTIQYIALVDRDHRELPVRTDYVGKEISTDPQDTVRVKVKEIDGVDVVALFTNQENQ
jgi:pyrimidine operon attenuation protein / uracil phosphoribosyltransferase